MKFSYFFIVCIFSATLLLGQQKETTTLSTNTNNISLLGYSGLLYTPSAYIAEWGEIYAGLTHYDKEVAFTFDAGKRNERSFVTNIGFLPFAEFSLRLTKPYNSKGEHYGIGDRSISGRVRLMKEKQHLPAVVIGVNDLGTESSFFNTSYVVLSKRIPYKTLFINGNLGYGFKLNEARRHYLQEFFGGVQVTWKSIDLITEYDTDQWNMGLGYTYKRFFYAKVALISMQHLSFNVGFQFNIR